jgi:primosomal protein N' (replication factor Y) (superfamily II helicase)
VYAEVIIDIASAEVDHVFTYRVPDGMHAVTGMRVNVPFGMQKKEGYILGIKAEPGYDINKIRDIESTLEDYPALLQGLLELAHEIAAVSRCPIADALRLMLPAQMRGGRVHAQTEWTARLLLSGAELAQARKDTKGSKRKLILELLTDLELHPVSELSALIRSPKDALEALSAKGYIEYTQREFLRSPYHDTVLPTADPALMPEQQEALSEFIPAIHAGKGKFLLYGVTGSGKTELYIRIVRECLRQGKGAIVLVPEIVLTPQMVSWFRGRFGDVAAVMHSRLTPGERYDEWRRIRSGSARVVIGARSAVFAPVERLGAVIVDEEHEQSYLSEKFPQYDAREIARSRADREGAILLLASATPSILTYARAERGDYMLVELPHRVMGRPMPHVDVVDMREELRLGNKNIFSTLLRSRLEECIGKGQQAMLFLNRRGYAPFVNCRKCGYVAKCAQCDVSMTYHIADNQLHCHYCGARENFPGVCPSCGSTHIKACGIGTQRVEEEVIKCFPEVGVIRMDYDTTASRDAHYTLLNRFRAGQAQILIGTQMIAKGLDFPNVTLVGAVLADLTLNLPDYRSPERTFQLILQVAGRAGRADMPGEVIVQTYTPAHYAIVAAAAQDYRAFFKAEFARRKRDLYPPFTLMARLLCEARDMETARSTSLAVLEKIEAFLQQFPDLKRRVLFIRQDDAPFSKLMGQARAHVIVKLLNPNNEDILAGMQKIAGEPWPARVVLEINPASMA